MRISLGLIVHPLISTVLIVFNFGELHFTGNVEMPDLSTVVDLIIER